MIRVLLVDDEAPARQRMIRMLGRFDGVEIVGEASDGLRAVAEIQRLAPDLVFLDIDMPELDGLEVARSLGSEGPAIVFVTAYDEHALKAFELSATDYLVKPVSDTRLEEALRKIRRRASGPSVDLEPLFAAFKKDRRPRKLAIRSGSRFVVLDSGRVSAILSKDHYSALLMEGRELLADDPMDVLIARLDPAQFIRVHRGAAINLDFLVTLEREGDRKFVAVLSDAAKTRVAVSRERLPGLKARLGVTD